MNEDYKHIQKCYWELCLIVYVMAFSPSCRLPMLEIDTFKDFNDAYYFTNMI